MVNRPTTGPSSLEARGKTDSTFIPDRREQPMASFTSTALGWLELSLATQASNQGMSSATAGLRCDLWLEVTFDSPVAGLTVLPEQILSGPLQLDARVAQSRTQAVVLPGQTSELSLRLQVRLKALADLQEEFRERVPVSWNATVSVWDMGRDMLVQGQAVQEVAPWFIINPSEGPSGLEAMSALVIGSHLV